MSEVHRSNQEHRLAVAGGLILAAAPPASATFPISRAGRTVRPVHSRFCR